MVCPLNCCHPLQQSSHSSVLWWMPAIGPAKHQGSLLRVCGLLGSELVHGNAIQTKLGMDNKQQEVTYKFMWNWIICIFEDKERKWVRDAVLLFFFLMACGILVPHQGLKLCPLQWNHSLNHWRVSVSHSVVSDSLRTHDHCLPGSSVLGILQARILEWGAILFSRGSSKPRDQTHISCIAGRFFTIWAISSLLLL